MIDNLIKDINNNCELSFVYSFWITLLFILSLSFICLYLGAHICGIYKLFKIKRQFKTTESKQETKKE